MKKHVSRLHAECSELPEEFVPSGQLRLLYETNVIPFAFVPVCKTVSATFRKSGYGGGCKVRLRQKVGWV